MTEGDWKDVNCSRWREAISALADGEHADIDERLVTAHIAHCPACQSYRETIQSSPGIVLVGDAAEMPDLSKTISKLNAAADRAAHWSVLRIVLAVVAAQVVAFALPALILGKENGVATHSARHLGAFGVAYGVALFVVVARPARARSILPVALVLAGAQVLGAIVDLATGKIPLAGEARHLPQIISVFLIWFLAVPSTRRGDTVGEPAGAPRLKIVDGKRRAG
jgi:predicted anti-sigma-YlaC factor YlaD